MGLTRTIWDKGMLSFLLMLAAYPVHPLRLNMSAPAVIDYREDMQLDCRFDMGGELLYAVKWYKDDHEFFRYMPNQEPHQITFPVFGVRLLPGGTECGTTRCLVTLTGMLRIKSSGAYRCEVSSEAPSFRLASETHNVTVAAVPKDRPSIEDIADAYFEGEILTARCVSSPSDPPQLITWFINKDEAPAKFVRDLKTSKPDENGLVSTSQIIRFAIERNYTEDKYVQISCVAGFEGCPASEKRTSCTVAIYDHGAHANNPSFTYWHTSGAKRRRSYLAALVLVVLVIR